MLSEFRNIRTNTQKYQFKENNEEKQNTGENYNSATNFS
jgi:hypothetical protein